jgi:hypothetical protein
MEWLAMAIRTYKGQASVVQVQGFDDLPDERLKQFFIEARLRDYHKLLCEAKKLPRIFSHAKAYRTPEADSPAGPGPSRDRLFGNPLRTKLEILLAQANRRG